MRGQTPGKRAMRIRVVDVFGRTPSGMDLFVRWIFRVLDIWLSLGTLAVVLITTSPRSMRLGGLLANTMVIKVEGFGGVSLQDILTIDDKFSISPEYAEVHKFRESDMLTVKSVLDRYRKYGNEAHKKLLNATAEKCREVLDLETLPDNRYLFLQTLLRDYIISTRN